MIKTVAGLLDELMHREADALNSANITHPTTIGDQYEHLTADVLKRALPESLSIVRGFIRKEDATLSGEFDCMLVSGNVEDIPYSDRKICQIANVLAVIQVKKNLYGKDIEEGHDNLREVRNIKPSGVKLGRDTVASAFQLISQTPLPNDVKSLPPHLQMLYHQLVTHLATPVCILLGYYGYKGHRSFREGIAEHLKSLVGKHGYGPLSLPDVILNRDVAAVKNTGAPWVAPFDKDWWPCYLTSRIGSPAEVALESIWTRLVMRGLCADDLFGEDLSVEPWVRLLDYRFDEPKQAWQCRTYEDRPVSEVVERPGEWTPVFLSKQQFILVNSLCEKEAINIPDLAAWELTEHDIAYLTGSGLVGRDVNEATYRLLTRQCQCCFLPDGRCAAGENNSGRLTRWASHFMAEWKAKNTG